MPKFIVVLACLLLAACGPRDTRPDPQKLAGFHTAVAALDQRVTAASDAYTKASNAALDRNDNTAFVAAARRLGAALSGIRPDAAALTAPDFENSAARDAAGQVLAALLAGIDANADAARAAQNLRDPHHPAPDEIATLQTARDRVSAASLAESNALFSLNEALGGQK